MCRTPLIKNWLIAATLHQSNSLAICVSLLADYTAQLLVSVQPLDLAVIDFLTWVTGPGWQQGLIERAAGLQALSQIRVQALLKAPAASFVSGSARAREEGGPREHPQHGMNVKVLRGGMWWCIFFHPCLRLPPKRHLNAVIFAAAFIVEKRSTGRKKNLRVQLNFGKEEEPVSPVSTSFTMKKGYNFLPNN